jgi:hypothetical protein
VVPVVDNGGIEIASFDYNVLTAGVGYAINQTLQQLHLIDTVAGTITATLWFNKDTQLTIAAPLPTHVQPTTDRIESLTVDLTALTGYQKFRITYVAKTASPGISINDLIEAEDTYRGGVLLSQEYTNINTGLAIAVGQAYPAWSPLDYEILLSNTEATQLAVDATNVNTAPYVNIVDSSAGLAAVVSAGGVAVSGNSNQIVVGLSPNSNKVQLTNGLIDASLLNSQPLTSSNALVTVASPNSSNFSSLDAGTLAIRASLSAGRFITTRPVLTNLQQHSLRLNTDGALITAPDVIGITRFGTTNPTADTVVPVGKKIFRVFITNGNTTTLFIQFHSSATPLVTGSVPTAGFILRVPANSTSGWNEKDFGSSGELFTNLRIGISTTFVNFTAPSGAQLLLTSLSVKHES